MSDSVDIRLLLENWPYDSDHDARLVRGNDGREILQVRTPVGIEQYEVDGRPDGARPHGRESALDYYMEQMALTRDAGKLEEFQLGAHACTELFGEGTLYYFRYVRFFQLKDWERTLRDTTRNLRAFDFIHRYAQRSEDRNFLEKWRPYVLRVNATAAAMQYVENAEFDPALQVLTSAVAKIEALEQVEDETFQFEYDRSLAALRELSAQIQQHRPVPLLEKLERELKEAISSQEFEQAAQLRDRIRALRDKQHQKAA